MDFKSLNDQELLVKIQGLVESERNNLVLILHHLREVEKRKLFSDLGYQGLFEYCVGELKYSEGQAGRRIQAMRLLKELPEVEEKLKSGALSLSNISQAQGYFREKRKALDRLEPSLFESSQNHTLDKLKVLNSLENKSARDGQRILLDLHKSEGREVLPKESERMISPDVSEMRFPIDEDLREKIDEFKSLLGVNEQNLSFSQLMSKLLDFGIEGLKAKKFGKKRVKLSLLKEKVEVEKPKQGSISNSKNQRYSSQKIKYEVWNRDHGKCIKCGSRKNIQYDHIQPVALGGESSLKNLRLLCHHCNQREGIRHGLVETWAF